MDSLNADGTVKSHQKISDTEGGFTGSFYEEEIFAEAITGLGDLDGDGALDLAVGAPGDQDSREGTPATGAVWVLFMRTDPVAPSCQLADIDPGPPTRYNILARDNQSGLAAITPLDTRNLSLDISSFTPGSTTPITLTATRLAETSPVFLQLELTDVAGNSASCTPITGDFTIEVAPGAVERNPGDGECSLAEAIENANTDTDTSEGDCTSGGGAEMIALARGATYVLRNALPAIYTGLTIAGRGATLEAAEDAPSFNILSDEFATFARPVALRVDSLTVRNASGVGIITSGSLQTIITNSVIEDNSEGGIGASHTVEIRNTTVRRNGGTGGVVVFVGALSIANSTISDNALFGAAWDGGSLDVVNSTFSGNTLAAFGMDFENGSGGPARISHSTLVGTPFRINAFGYERQADEAPPPTGGTAPLAHWPLDERTDDTALDATGGGLDAHPLGNPRPLAGRFASARFFDGQDDALTVDHDPRLDLTDALTLSAWFYRQRGSFDATGLDKRRTYRLLSKKDPDDPARAYWFFDLWNDEGTFFRLTSTRTLANDAWHHVVGTFDGSEMRLYFDGELEARRAAPGPVRVLETPLELGRRDGQRYYRGRIDEVLLFGRALSEEEVLALYGGAVPGAEQEASELAKAAVAQAAQGEAVPEAFALEGNYPNPFNPSTTIRYVLPEAAPVTLEVFDVLGRRVAMLLNAVQEAGRYEAVWDGRSETGTSVAGGVYVLRLRAGSFEATRTMVMLK